MQSAILRTQGEYTIRRCAEEQVKDVIDINCKTLPEHYSDEFYYEMLSAFAEGFLVAMKGEAVVGYIIDRVEFGFSNMRGFSLTRKGHVVSVAVLDENRRAGLGRALVEEGMRAAQAKGCKEVFLEVRITNTVAVHLYENLGLKIVQKLPGYYRDGEDAYLMAKGLS